PHNELPTSFPTRRSSDLAARAADHVQRGARRRAPNHHCGETEMNEKLIFNCTWGRKEPERATLPFIAANIAATAGQEAVVLCTIDRKSTRLNSSHVAISY